jgi:hypothetical protein
MKFFCLGAGVFGHSDKLRGISEAIVAGTMVSVGTGSDFRMVPCNIETNIPPQPKRKRFTFQAPDIKAYIKNTSSILSDDAITLDLNPQASLSEALATHANKRVKRSNTGGNTDTVTRITTTPQPVSFTYSRKGAPQILRPSSPTPVATSTHYGTLGLLVPSSPKKRKPSERRKLRKGQIPKEDEEQMLTLEPLTSFFEPIAKSTEQTYFTAKNAVWRPSSP